MDRLSDGQAFGWSKLASVYAGAVIAISSTTIIVKAFEEQKIKEKFTQIVFGILIVEDLIAILLLTFLRPLAVAANCRRGKWPLRSAGYSSF